MRPTCSHGVLALKPASEITPDDDYLPALLLLSRKKDGISKARLVACGQFEETEGIRTDSPTADVEALNLLCSFAACGKLRLKCADIRNAYFNAEPLDRLMLLRPPRGGSDHPKSRTPRAAWRK